MNANSLQVQNKLVKTEHSFNINKFWFMINTYIWFKFETTANRNYKT